MPTAAESTTVAATTEKSVDAASARPPIGRVSRRPRVLAAAAVVSLAVALIVALGWTRWFAGEPPAPVIIASGRIEGRDVTIAPKDIQGRVSSLFADEGQTVTRGQLLAVLEAKQLEARVASLTASMAAIDAQIRQALLDVDYTAKSSAASIAAGDAAVSVARARLSRARAVSKTARADFERANKLYSRDVASERERDQAELALRTAEADVDAATKDLSRAEAELTLAHASKDAIALKRQQVLTLQETRRSAAGQLAEAQAYLGEREVRAPADGTILSRPVEIGDVVSPGSAMFQLIDMNRLYVKVYVPEPDIPKLKLGDSADVTVDAFPGRQFAARVSKIHEQAEFTPKNVETLDERLKLVFGVELTLVNPDRLLKPGMPADCVIHWTSPSRDSLRHAS